MKTKKTTNGTGTHAASFRISEEQYQEFQELLASVPGSEVGNMYREIFSRGLEGRGLRSDLVTQATSASWMFAA